MHPKKELLCSRLGGSWILRSRVISRVTILITHIRGLITLLITTPEPPSSIYPSIRRSVDLPMFVNVIICIRAHMHIYIYRYGGRERERENERKKGRN